MYIIQIIYKDSNNWLKNFSSDDFKYIDAQFTWFVKQQVTSGGYLKAARLLHTGPPPDYVVREVLRYQEFKEV